jgi:hypothetical protein
VSCRYVMVCRYAGDCSHVLGADSGTVMTVDWCPTSEFMLASGSADGMVSIWDIRQGGYKALLTSMDYLQDAPETTLGSGSGSEGGGGGRVIQSTTVNPKSRKSNVSVPAASTWNKHVNRIAHSREVTSVRFSSCGHHLVSLGNDRNVRLWNAHSGKLYPIKYARGCHYRMHFQVDISEAKGHCGDLLLYPDDSTGEASTSYCLMITLMRTLTTYRRYLDNPSPLLYWRAHPHSQRTYGHGHCSQAPPRHQRALVWPGRDDIHVVTNFSSQRRKYWAIHL